MGFTLTVIGCGSATPVGHRLSSAFILKRENQTFMIDCGEASQLFLKDYQVRMQRIGQIYISHLHGDHFFGLVGLLSSMHLFGRKHPLHLFAPPALEQIIQMQLDAGGTVLQYPLVFHPTQDRTEVLLYEDDGLEVRSFPLNHGLPTTGFLFREKERQRSISKTFLEEHTLSPEEMRCIRRGEDYTDPQGVVWPNAEITRPSRLTPKSFAYCSDTIYDESIIPYIRHVDLLYHETTFLEGEAELAESRFHTTARQAAMIAKKAEVKKLLVGHYSARYKGIQCFVDEASEIFDDVVAASEGLVLDI